MVYGNRMRPVILGTAGHIDHGKTALVKALTGTDTDRLKEEQSRGITIELGYAFLNEQIAIIDVPGHERFIKNMVAGVATVDYALLVIAADDGIMPQTREHFDILRLLDVTDGLVALTKCDLAEDDWIDLVEEEITSLTEGSFLENKPVMRVDSLSKRGIDELKAAIIELAGRKKEQAPGSIFRLPVDRVFSMKGFGTVVTGSALSGSVAVDDKLTLLPQGEEVRVRGIQSQGKTHTTATAGMRLALNVTSLGVDDISRGNVFATPSRLNPTFMIDASCRVLENSPVPLEQRQRIRLHIGTKELMARAVILDSDRLEPGQEGLVQFRLEERIAAQRLDRYVIRRYSPQITMGGGRLLDAHPQKHRKRHVKEVVNTLQLFGDSKTDKLLQQILDQQKVLPFDDLVTRSGLSAEQVEETIGTLCIEGDVIELEAKGNRHVCPQKVYEEFIEGLVAKLDAYHKKYPLRGGVKRNEILASWKKQLPDFLIKHFVELGLSNLTIKSMSGDLLARYDFSVQLTKKQRAAVQTLEETLRGAGFRPPLIGLLAADLLLDEKQTRQLLQILVDQGKAINLEGKIYFHMAIVDKGVSKLQEAFKKQTELTMSEFRTLVDTSRKYSIPLLNYYDSKGYTLRREAIRIAGTKLYAKE